MGPSAGVRPSPLGAFRVAVRTPYFVLIERLGWYSEYASVGMADVGGAWRTAPTVV